MLCVCRSCYLALYSRGELQDCFEKEVEVEKEDDEKVLCDFCEEEMENGEEMIMLVNMSEMKGA